MRHYFLSDRNCARRLIEEYEKFGTLWVAYDFDNTVYDYHKKGHDYEEVTALIRELKEVGCKLIVFTAEKDLGHVLAYLHQHDIPYDLVNENPPFFRSPDESRKIFWNILLDDRAGLLSAFRQCKALLAHIARPGNSAAPTL